MIESSLPLTLLGIYIEEKKEFVLKRRFSVFKRFPLFETTPSRITMFIDMSERYRRHER